MSQRRAFRVNQPFVASELIDGEAVIMNLNTGNYYSARQVGGHLWAWIGQGIDQEALVSRLAAIYTGDAEKMSRAVDSFIGQLLEQELIVETSAQPSEVPPSSITAVPASERLPFKAPVLEVFADMRDLLLLDPIHDVAEVGWPTAKPTRPASQ